MSVGHCGQRHMQAHRLNSAHLRQKHEGVLQPAALHDALQVLQYPGVALQACRVRVRVRVLARASVTGRGSVRLRVGRESDKVRLCVPGQWQKMSEARDATSQAGHQTADDWC